MENFSLPYLITNKQPFLPLYVPPLFSEIQQQDNYYLPFCTFLFLSRNTCPISSLKTWDDLPGIDEFTLTRILLDHLFLLSESTLSGSLYSILVTQQEKIIRKINLLPNWKNPLNLVTQLKRCIFILLRTFLLSSISCSNMALKTGERATK